MAVSFTPNIGLAKPDTLEQAVNWIESAQLYDDNNLIIEDKTDINLVAYTPVIGASTTAPSVGSGTRKGEYQDIQGWIQGSFVIEFLDPGVTGGTGDFGISLPVPADGTFHTVGTAFNNNTGANSCIGTGYVYDGSSVTNSGSCALDVITVTGVSYARLVLETFTGKTGRVVGANNPITMATLDRWSGTFIYKKA